MMRLKKVWGHQKKTFSRLSTSASVFLFLGIALLSLFRTFQKEMTPPVVLPALASVPKLKTERAPNDPVSRVDTLCKSLPRPERFEFVSKTAPTETEQFVSIAYTYRSPRADSEIYPTFIVWFANNGWTDDKPVYERDKKPVYERDKKPVYEKLEFSKGDQTVRFMPPYTSGLDDLFMVSCIEWKIASTP